MELESDPAAVASARQFVSATLWAMELDCLMDEATLVVSELVTNAVIHARTAVAVGVTVTPEKVRIAVSDDNSRLPVVGETPEDATSGRGLHLVGAIAQAWGVEEQATAKVVWAELPRPGAPD
jgi:serine/threonine-protein kinase RsbW